MPPQFVNLFCNDLRSDIKILIEKENVEYPAHKLIIGNGSHVLENMVYGSKATLPTSVIVVPNYSSKEFLPVLKYLYTGDMEWNLDNYNGILEVGNYLGLTELENMFKIYVADTINYGNVLDIYTRYYHANDYVGHIAMKIIQLILDTILSSAETRAKFFELPTEASSQILRMDELNVIGEEQIFNAMKAWASTKDEESLSSVFGGLVNLIRFSDIIIAECCSNREVFDVFSFGKANIRWKIKVINRTSSTETETTVNGELQPNANTEIIHIGSRGRAIRLHGLSTLSSEAIYLEKNNDFETIDCCRSKIFQHRFFDVMFEKPIEIGADVTIQLKVPVCSTRYDFNDLDNDSYFVRADRLEQAGINLPILAIFISTPHKIEFPDNSDLGSSSHSSQRA